MEAVLTLVTAPTSEPVDLAADVKPHVRVEHTADDALLTRLIPAARMRVEARTERQLLEATWELRLDAFPACGVIVLPRPPLVSVQSVKYVDLDGVVQTVSTDVYASDVPAGPACARGLVRLKYNQVWPSARAERGAVRVQFKAGYGTTGSSVPAPLISALLLYVGDMYVHRESGVIGTIYNSLPCAEALLMPFWSAA